VIVESIVTSVSSTGAVNVAPMGVEWGEQTIVLKPFLDTATYRNLIETRAAVVHLVDDVRIFALCAISDPSYPTEPAAIVHGAVLLDCCSWREVTIDEIDSTPPRARMRAGVAHRGMRREFIGFNRARHAVLEAAIYATRIHLLEPQFLRDELARLQVIVGKTAGEDATEAMRVLTTYIESAIARGRGERGDS
jgi:uncharacterized protein